MLEISENYIYKIKFEGIVCKFIPDIQKKYEYLPEIIKGYVIFACNGEYNPNSWKKKITINKTEIIN